MTARKDGPKGWRLELLETSPRRNIQAHRAHKSMYIEGCILPVHFEDFVEPSDHHTRIKKGDLKIQQRSEAIMKVIKSRYDELHKDRKDRPTLTISALLPASISTGTAYA